jgi:tripartite-type tricarboxylate transporter receptor subunit TctC
MIPPGLTRMIYRRWLVAATAVLSAWMAGDGVAQGYPQRPVRLVVPAPAGGGPTDTPARLVADALGNLIGQRVVVENRPGAGGLVAGEAVARAAADGYTLLFTNSSVLAINPALYSKMPYDPATAFTVIVWFSNSPQLLVANPKVPYQSVKEMVEWAKANPGKLNFASGGPGTLPHLTYELFRAEAGFSAVHVPYAGGGPATVAVIAGQADVLFDLVRTRVKSGELRALAITGERRDPDLPDVPTMAESGYPAVTSTSWTGIVGPAGVPSEVVMLINAKVNELVRSPDLAARAKAIGLVPKGGTPEEFAAWAAAERERWARVVRMSGARVD